MADFMLRMARLFFFRMDIHVRRRTQKRCRSEGCRNPGILRLGSALWPRLGQECPGDRSNTRKTVVKCKRPGKPFLPRSVVLGPVNSGLWAFSGEVSYERMGAGLA